MKELHAIIDNYELARQAGEALALATVVHVEGSSYRMPGARMLVQQNGRMTGAISGGCLEGDALRKALFAIGQKSNMLVTYDTSDDDLTLGVQLGCNGIVHILFEPIDFTNPRNPVELLKACVDGERQPAALVTLFSLQRAVPQMGTVFFNKGAQSQVYLTKAELLKNHLEEHAKLAIESQQSFTGSLRINDVHYQAFYEFISPPISLCIVGAGNDALPLLAIAKSLGWQVTVIDGRESHLTKARFPSADRLLLRQAADALSQTTIDPQTAVVLMTHNYQYDKMVLAELLKTKVGYVGCLGPKKKLVRMLDELREAGNHLTAQDIARIYGPVGLNIGAEAPEEVALAIVAEILAVFRSANAGFLKDQAGGVHKRFKDGSLLPKAGESVLEKSDQIAATNFTCSLNTPTDA